jgi:circadian clock protein KaiC
MYERERIATGIDGFDRLIEGGLIQNSVTLVSGKPGCGKTIFSIQFLVEGIKHHNENGFYLTFEENKERLYADMLEFGWDLAKLEKEKKFVFVDYTPEQIKDILVEGGGSIDAIISKYQIKRMVIDSITSFALLYKDELSKKEASLALFNLLRKWGVTSILTSQDVSLQDDVINGTLEFEADGIILIYHVRKKGGRIRAVEVLKMRGTKIPERTYPLKIIEEGISINPKEPVEI